MATVDNSAIYEIAKEFLIYDEETGFFFWKKKPGKYFHNSCDMRAGSLYSNGYRTIKLKGNRVLEHRLAWFFHYNSIPDRIDHINHITYDNRIVNLRLATIEENAKNTKISTKNTSGIMGVSFEQGRRKWRAFISSNKKEFILGRFDRFSDAVQARKSAELKYGYHENHGKTIVAL